MDLSSIYSEIKQFLSISDEKFDLEQSVNYFFKREPDEIKLEIVSDILSFVNNFSLFRTIKPFMNSLYTYINNTLEIKPKTVLDFEDYLIKNSPMHFVQEYINYSKLSQKDQVLQYLTDSLEKLQAKPLIINLGLLLKPMYNDQDYLNNLKNLKEVEVTYNLPNETEIQIKNEIDNWLKSQKISLDNQEELKIQLKKELERLFIKYNLSKDSDKSNNLQLEVMEMLTMKLVMLSLTEQISDDPYEPIPIK